MKTARRYRGSADTIIATLLLIAIAIAGTALVYRNMVTVGQNVGGKPSITVMDKELRVLGGGSTAFIHFTISNDGTIMVTPIKMILLSPSGTNVTKTLSANPIASGKQWSYDGTVSLPTGFKQGEIYTVIITLAYASDTTKTFTVQFDITAV